MTRRGDGGAHEGHAMMTATDVAAFHADYDGRHPGDHVRLFAAVARAIGPARVLYPGSYVDIAPSVLFDDVTYVDTDRWAVRFFAQTEAVAGLVRRKRIATRDAPAGTATLRFHEADYRTKLPIADASVDLLVSLYAGFVSEHCTRYLAPGGLLLVNSSHGDVAMATLHPTYALAAVVTSRAGRYRLRTDDLGRYLIPRRGHPPSVEELHRTNRGIAYTRAAYAYLFRKTGAARHRPR
jgi:hypothetical protein